MYDLLFDTFGPVGGMLVIARLQRQNLTALAYHCAVKKTWDHTIQASETHHVIIAE